MLNRPDAEYAGQTYYPKRDRKIGYVVKEQFGMYCVSFNGREVSKHVHLAGATRRMTDLNKQLADSSGLTDTGD